MGRKTPDLDDRSSIPDGSLLYFYDPSAPTAVQKDCKIEKADAIEALGINDVEEAVEDLAGTGRTTETVKGNSDRLDTVEGERLTGNVTVNLLTTKTATEKQALIDAQPKNLNGYTLTFQLEDGTHNHTSSLTISGFYGGTVILRGNTSDTSSSSTKTVTISCGANNFQAVIVSTCFATVFLQYFSVTGSGWGSTDTAVRFQQTPSVILMGFTVVSSGSTGRVYMQRNVRCQATNCYYANMGAAIYMLENCSYSEGGTTHTGNTTDYTTSVSMVITSRSTATTSKGSGQISLNGTWV